MYVKFYRTVNIKLSNKHYFESNYIYDVAIQFVRVIGGENTIT